eukprot:13505145-Alexandrium_andersonii.AAC.1
MSASLVGSEMCIRDRLIDDDEAALIGRVPAVGEVDEGRSRRPHAAPGRPGRQRWIDAQGR